MGLFGYSDILYIFFLNAWSENIKPEIITDFFNQISNNFGVLKFGRRNITHTSVIQSLFLWQFSIQHPSITSTFIYTYRLQFIKKKICHCEKNCIFCLCFRQKNYSMQVWNDVRVHKLYFKRNSSPKNENLHKLYSPSDDQRCWWVYWSRVDYLWIIVMFWSAGWTLILTAPIHPLVSKWYNAKLPQIYSDEETYSSTSWMAWRWVHFQQIFLFGWTVPLNIHI